MISNLGRIKRLEYETQYRNGAIYVKPERIIKPGIIKQTNRFKQDHIFFLAGRTTLNARRYNFTIARLVYYCFVESIDLEDHRIIIYCKDGNNFNIRPSNLQKQTIEDKQRRIVRSGRTQSPFLTLDKSFLQKIREANFKKAMKRITQYSMEGKKIMTFPSITAAAQATGGHATSIGHVAAGNKISASGFMWRFGNDKQIDVASLKKVKLRKYREKYGQKVTQYDLQGKKISSYPSLKDAAEATGASAGCIALVIKGVYKSAKGYFWQNGYGKPSINLSGYQVGRSSAAATLFKKVKQYSLNGKYIATFKSLKEAAAALNASSSTISEACRGLQKTSHGYRWKFAGV